MRVDWNGKWLKTYPFCDCFGYHKFRARRGEQVSKQWLDDFYFKPCPKDLVYAKAASVGKLEQLIPYSQESNDYLYGYKFFN